MRDKRTILYSIINFYEKSSVQIAKLKSSTYPNNRKHLKSIPFATMMEMSGLTLGADFSKLVE